ncbi:MAG: excinuclease ABC subunit UvrA [Thermodesulfobacteriota bacterium]|nr:excinuclease ABC subunit UvrA [Thermodesulfobacteriota bacterium]
MVKDRIIIKGAREHNLKNIDVEIPRDKLMVITGLSGSGKSTLAFDTIYAEGHRRYVESLSAYARQFLEQMEKPDVDSIEGLSPAIAIEQKSVSKNPRSTVATVTEIYDYLRLLFARVGKPHCYNCGKEIVTQTVSQMVDQIMQLQSSTKILILAPIVRGRKGEYKKELLQLSRSGFVRVKIDGQMFELGSDINLDKNKKHEIDVVVDRIVIKDGIQSRLADSIETSLNLSDGLVKIEIIDGSEIIFSQKFACAECGVSYLEITPRMFSFNNPYGACPECMGLGMKMHLDPDLIVPNEELSIREGAIVPWEKRNSIYYHEMLDALAKHLNFDIYTPFKHLSEEAKRVLLFGSGDQKIEFYTDENGKRAFYLKPFEGIITSLDSMYRNTTSFALKEEIKRYMSMSPCSMCNGTRLKKESLFVKFAGFNINDVTKMSIKDAFHFFHTVSLPEKEKEIARRILKEIVERLTFLTNVGLDYLTLDRPSATLSGGEGQRIRLATQIGSSLVGVLYILDEPSIGLHQKDNMMLLSTLKRLRDLGNTVLVVEHDEETIMSADYIIDMGPLAGLNGGEVVFEGTPKEIVRDDRSLTGKYLSRKLQIRIPEKRRVSKRFITIKGARGNNLKEITVSIPVGVFTCVTGVSGSGKSTLIIDTLYRVLMQYFFRSREKPAPYDTIEGITYIDKVININQSPIGRTPRSNPATYTGVFTYIREIFAKLPESKVRGYKPGRYSFNVKGGRCEACEGDGIIKIEMHFLPDVYVMCEVCRGKRYKRETLEIKYKGKNIADILNMSVDEAVLFMGNIPSIKNKLSTLKDVGLGYIKLGQSATTLSGGEAQRIKLARELSKKSTGKTLYILDEPTTGLHFADIEKLLDVLNRLTDAGNTVVVIEHNMEVIKSADYVIDLGPDGGDMGGKVITKGSPEKVATVHKSYTGQFLKRYLKR